MNRAYEWWEVQPMAEAQNVAMNLAVFAVWMIPLWGGFACVSTNLICSGEMRKDVIKTGGSFLCRPCSNKGGGAGTGAGGGSLAKLLNFLRNAPPSPLVDWSAMLAPRGESAHQQHGDAKA